MPYFLKHSPEIYSVRLQRLLPGVPFDSCNRPFEVSSQFCLALSCRVRACWSSSSESDAAYLPAFAGESAVHVAHFFLSRLREWRRLVSSAIPNMDSPPGTSSISAPIDEGHDDAVLAQGGADELEVPDMPSYRSVGFVEDDSIGRSVGYHRRPASVLRKLNVGLSLPLLMRYS